MKKIKMARNVPLTFSEGCNNLLVSEAAKRVGEFNVLDKFYGRSHIPMERGDTEFCFVFRGDRKKRLQRLAFYPMGVISSLCGSKVNGPRNC